MEKFDKILELLEKKTITESEKQTLEKLAESDSEIKSFIRLFKVLDKNLSAKGHIQTDLLSSFILFEKGDEPDNKLIPLIRHKIQSHLDECNICRDEYKDLLQNYNEIKEHVDMAIDQDSLSRAETDRKFLHLFASKYSSVKYAFAMLVVLVIGYFGLFVISSSITPYYNKNLFSDKADDFYKTRGRTSVLFQQGLSFLERENYGEAIKYLLDDVEKNPNEQSIFYSYYIVGIAYLKDSESDFIGLFRSYDKNKVSLAIKNLKASIDKNITGDYESLKLDTYYYLGRAYLLNNDLESARFTFQKVIDDKGRFFNEANELIMQLEKN